MTRKTSSRSPTCECPSSSIYRKAPWCRQSPATTGATVMYVEKSISTGNGLEPAHSASAASAAYGSSAVAPTIYSKNWWYNVAYPVVGNPPSNATITTVYYSWSYSYPRPTGLLVYLCNNTGSKCWNVTSFGSGSINMSGEAIPANQSLRLYSRVNGTGTMSPLYGGSTNVTVNYVY